MAIVQIILKAARYYINVIHSCSKKMCQPNLVCTYVILIVLGLIAGNGLLVVPTG